MFLVFVYLQIILITFNFSVLAQDGPLVTLPNGVIRGRIDTTVEGQKEYYSFVRIPFATPPLGNLRFKAPIPPENWEGVLDATQSNALCYQVSLESDLETEDCLYLNVHTPKLSNSENNTNLPVIFYIYGGGFIGGATIMKPQFLIEQDVVVVLTNYRVGPFGFLSTQDTVIPGNNGLKDQLLALKWTKQNIALFGGDPEKITMFGQSAGAAAVTYQLLHTESEGLFRGAIGSSGSFLSAWAFQRKAREIAFQTAGFINETFNEGDDSEALLEFLTNVSADELDEASYAVFETEGLQNRQLSQGFFYAPVIEPEHEGAFITEKMYGSLKAGNIIKVPLFIGINSEEDIDDALDLDVLHRDSQLFDENLDWLVPNDMQIEDLVRRRQVGQQIRQIYVKNSTFEGNLGPMVRYFSDNSFTRSVIMHAEIQSEFTDVYFYKFSYDGAVSSNNVSLEDAEKVGHSHENIYIWDLTNNEDFSIYSESDQLTHRRLIKILTDFAKTLNPTPEISDLLQNIVWPRVNDGGRGSFLYVDIDEDLAIKDQPKETFRGWNEIYANLGYDDFDTY